MSSKIKKILFLTTLLGIFPLVVFAAPAINLSIPMGGPSEQIATPLKIVLLLTFLTFLPAVVISATSFTRIIVVFSFLRQAMGLQSAPPNQVLVGLSLFMTFSVMSPVFQEMNKTGIQPYLEGSMNEYDAFARGLEPLRKFMYAQTRKTDLNVMLDISATSQVESFDDLPTVVLVPAFILSELKTAFEIGFMIYIPFLVIDMVVSMTLLAMGMMVLPPVVISMPFKLLLFIVVDGWDLVVTSLVKSFR